MIKPHHQACFMMGLFSVAGIYLSYCGYVGWGWVCMVVVIVFTWIAIVVYQEPIKQRGEHK